MSPLHKDPKRVLRARFSSAYVTGVNAYANVPRPSVSSPTSLHHSPQRHRLPAVWADSGRRGTQRSEVKEEAKGRGTRTALSTACPLGNDCNRYTPEIR